MEKTEIEDSSPLPNKPEWLQKLEEESWQAELIISGLAIYGTLQTPELIEWLMDWCLVGIDERFFKLLYFFFTYLGIGAYFLIFIFIGHFVLRAVWVGLVGLSSVFPKGVNEDSEAYSKHFIQKFIADHPDQNLRIRQLDQLCSVLFGLGAQLVMIFMAINIDIVILGVVWYALDSFLGATIGSIVSIVFFSFFIFYAILFFASNHKRLRDKPLVKRWQYPIYKGVQTVFLHIFARPASYLAMVFQTNLSLKRYVGIVVVMMFVVMLFFSSRFFNFRFISFMRPELLYEHYDEEDRLIPDHYASMHKGDRRLLSLELENDVVSGDFLRVFVPVFSRESAITDSLCVEFEEQSSSDDSEKPNYYTACYQKMHRFYVNDSLYQNQEIIRYQHPNQGEDGILIYLPTDQFKTGKNVLRVEKSNVEPGSVLRRMQALFWFE